MEVKVLDNSELESIARSCLKKYGYQDKPVDIERLCEDMGISILPTASLESDLDVHAYLTDNCSIIVIDKDCFDYQIPRARFSIAHELSHKILHEPLYASSNITDLNSYKKFHKSIDNTALKRIELQAHALAGYLLIPSKLLQEEIQSMIKPLKRISQLSISDANNVLHELANVFEVSDQAMFKQLSIASPNFYKILMT